MNTAYPFAISLSPTKRKTFGKRLLKLADLIQNLKPEQYYHGTFMKSCGTVGCALGHAALNNRLFKGFKMEWSAMDGLSWHGQGYYNVSQAADDYFGPNSYDTIMSEDAYDNGWSEDTPDGPVTNTQVVARILKVAREVHGVQPA